MNGVWSEFAEEEMYNNIPYEDMPTRKLKAILRELQNNGVGKGVKDLMEMRHIENILIHLHQKQLLFCDRIPCDPFCTCV